MAMYKPSKRVKADRKYTVRLCGGPFNKKMVWLTNPSNTLTFRVGQWYGYYNTIGNWQSVHPPGESK